MNREYAIALQFVQHHFRDLYKLATEVVLVPSHIFPPCQMGECSHDNFVSIRDGNYPIGHFVDTLVHELTHCQQNATHSKLNSQQREEEAYAAGIDAANQYMLKAAPWMKGKQ